MIWVSKSFEDLSALELYKILQLRIDVFMIEQKCLYAECDDKDIKGKHLFLMDDSICVAYARLLPPNVSYDNCTSIGRVLVNREYRNQNLGRCLMQKAIENTISSYPEHAIRISAQKYLEKFYTALGFLRVSEEYLEDNIPHIEMIYSNHQNN